MRKIISYLTGLSLLFLLFLSSVFIPEPAPSFAAPPPSPSCYTYNTCVVYVNVAWSGTEKGTKAEPFDTITEAVDFLKDSANDDYNAIHIAKGTYDELGASTTEVFPWTFSSSLGKSVHIRGGYDTAFTASNPLTNVTKIVASSEPKIMSFSSVAGTVSGLDITGVTGSGSNAVTVGNIVGDKDVTVQDNVFHDNNGGALSILATGSSVVTVKNNVFRDNLPQDVPVTTFAGNVTAFNNHYKGNAAETLLTCSLGAFVYNNYLLGNTVYSVVRTSSMYGSGNCTFANNTVARNTLIQQAMGFYGVIVMKSNTNDIVNNLITNNTGVSTATHEDGDTSLFRYNGLFANTSDPAMTDNNVNCDPKYPTTSGSDPDDVTLGAGSACIDKGTNLDTVTTDYFGTARPLDGNGDAMATHDPGADEAAQIGVIPPVISGLVAAPLTFSPDGDTVDDTTTVSFDVNNTATVSVVVQDSGNADVKKLIDNQLKTAGSVSAMWDGKDAGNNAVVNGTYTVKVYAVNGGGEDDDQVTLTVNNPVVAPPPPPTPPPTPSPEPTPVPSPPPSPSTQCAGFTDVPATHPDCAAIEYVKSIGAMTGNPDGTFAPGGLLQRDQIAKIVLITFNQYLAGTDYCGSVDPFPDVMASAWSYHYVCRGKLLGIITGYLSGEDAGFYRPARSVNRAEFLALLLRNLSDPMPSQSSSSYADVAANQWFSGYARYSMDHALFTGTNLLPTQATTRVEVAVVIFKLYVEGRI